MVALAVWAIEKDGAAPMTEVHLWRLYALRAGYLLLVAGGAFQRTR